MAKSTANDRQNESIVDVELFKIIGLHWFLHKLSIKNGYWGTGDWCRTLFMGILWLMCGLQCLQIIRLYLILNDLQLFIFVGSTATFALINVFKGYVLLNYADRFLAIMDVTQYSLTLCSRRDPSILRKYRNVLLPLLRSFFTFSFIIIALWIVAPLFLNEYVPFVKFDGTVGHYRPSINNIWLPLSETVYNWLPVWALIYVLESLNFATIVIISLMFDLYIVTICIALDAHLRTITTAYATLGWDDRHQGICTESKYYDELILYIQCNQEIIKIQDEFFNIIRSIIVCKIMCETHISITLIYSVLLLCYTGSSIWSLPIFKCVGPYGWNIIQLYSYCYVFSHLDTTKSELNNALWAGNWTERDLKFRKTLLIAMIMNSSHNRKMQASPTWIVNLEMFMRVMKISYTVVSVLINTRDKYT